MAKIRLCLVGMGRMGQEIRRLAAVDPEFEKIIGVEPLPYGLGDYSDLALVSPGEIDVVVNFTNAAASLESARICAAQKIPLVLGTTGLSQDEENKIRQLAQNIAILRSTNMSLGVNLLKRIMATFGKALASWDIDIIEGHHSGKLDAPSGTALTLAEELSLQLNRKVVYGNPPLGKGERRDSDKIIIHSFRAGSIPGEHVIIFSGAAEEIRIIHRAYSRELFAQGAVAAAKWLAGRDPGFYTMNDVYGL